MINRIPALLAFVFAPLAATAAAPPTLAIGSTVYEHRWSDGDFHEYTPTDQSDLERFSEMVTLPPSPSDYTAADLEQYTLYHARINADRGGDVVSRKCAPATVDAVANCTLLVIYSTPDHVEIALARHLAAAGQVVPILFSHRDYGADAAARAKAWMASAEGQRKVGEFIDWADGIARGIDGH